VKVSSIIDGIQNIFSLRPAVKKAEKIKRYVRVKELPSQIVRQKIAISVYFEVEI